jgi:hypothetical protein
MQSEDKPIGYWLKHLDQLIEDNFERALADHGLVRRHWQVLNALRGSPATQEMIAEGPFWTEDAVTPEEILGQLLQRGWIRQDDEGRYRLSPEGEAGHAAVAEQVATVRSALTRNVSREEYLAAVSTLRRMAENLESAR